MLVSNKITVTPNDEAYNAIKAYCKVNLISDNPEYLQAERMGLYCRNIPKKIKHYEVHGNNIILPFGLIDVLKQNNWVKSFETDFAEQQENDWDYDLHLYPYQQECVKAMLEAKHGIFIAPTGSGKTQMFIDLILKRKYNALIIVNTIDLLRQAKDRIESLTGMRVGTITGGQICIKEITVATVQTLSKIDLSTYSDAWGTVVCDECHLLSGSPAKASMFYKVMNSIKCLGKYGCTGTLHRADGLEKVAEFCVGEVKHVVDRSNVADKVMDAKIDKIELKTEKSFNYLKTDGTMDFCKLQNYLAENEHRNRCIAGFAQSAVHFGHSVLILCDRVNQIEEIYSRLPQDVSVMLTGSMTSKKAKADREQAIEDMRTGKKRCLVATVSLASTGLDIPCLDRLLFVSIQKDYTKVVQSVGRITRSNEGKEQPIVYDFVDTNIGYCNSAWRLRKRHYKKIGCEIIE